jgi:hypothetical protein
MVDQIVPKGRTQDGLTIVEIVTPTKIEKKYFFGIRCGLAWPISNEARGYFCLIGQHQPKLITGEWPLMVLTEGISLTLDGLFESMFNEMGIFGATEIFVDASPKYRSFVINLDDFRTKKRPTQPIIIEPAPFCQSFIHGFELINKWIHPDKKGLTIPKSFIIYEQLRNFKNQELDGEPELRFNAMNALRYVLGGFEVSLVNRTSSGTTSKTIPKEAWT